MYDFVSDKERNDLKILAYEQHPPKSDGSHHSEDEITSHQLKIKTN